MKLILLLLPLILSACTTNPRISTVPEPEQGFWVEHSGHGNAEKITLKWHDGKEQLIDRSGLVSNPVLDSDGQHIAYYKEKWRSGRTLIIHNIATGKAESYPLEQGLRYGPAWMGDDQSLVLMNKGVLARFDTKTKKLGYHLKHQSPEAISVSPDGKYLLSTARKGHHVNAIDGWLLQLFNIKSAQLKQLGKVDDDKGHFGPIFWSPDSKRFIINTHFLGGLDEQHGYFPGQRKVIKTASHWYSLDYKQQEKPKDDDLIYHPAHYPHVISVKHVIADKLDMFYRNKK